MSDTRSVLDVECSHERVDPTGRRIACGARPGLVCVDDLRNPCPAHDERIAAARLLYAVAELPAVAAPFTAEQRAEVLAATARTQAARGYELLASVLDEALEQAQAGKGRERHALDGEAFEEQAIVSIGELLGSGAFNVGQAIKKARESLRLPPDRARRDLLGAINYLAGEVIRRDREGRRG